MAEASDFVKRKRGPAAVYATESAKKRRKRERDNLWNKRRVNIAAAHDRWMELKEVHQLSTHEAVALLLLDNFDKWVWLSSVDIFWLINLFKMLVQLWQMMSDVIPVDW